jgi:hypothetical protein
MKMSGRTQGKQGYPPLKVDEMFDMFLYDLQIHTSLRTSFAHLQVFQRYPDWFWGDAGE